MKQTIIISSIIALILLVVFGFYNFYYTKSQISRLKETVQPESYKGIEGSWLEENSEFKQGFTLNADGSASSINMATLLYKKWKIESDKLILTAISLGNHSASVSNEIHTIKSYNHNKIILDDISYIKSSKTISPDTLTVMNKSFEYFPVDVENATKIVDKKHPIDFKSNPKVTRFRTVISEQYNTQPVNFGGYYTIATWGCGSGCIEGVMIDTRDGKVYDLPTKHGHNDIGNNIENQQNSIMLATSFGYLVPNSTKREGETDYWLWNESAKEYVHYFHEIKTISE